MADTFLRDSVRLQIGSPPTTNISDAQLDDCIDQALSEYSRYRGLHGQDILGTFATPDGANYNLDIDTANVHAVQSIYVSGTAPGTEGGQAIIQRLHELEGSGGTGYEGVSWEQKNGQLWFSDVIPVGYYVHAMYTTAHVRTVVEGGEGEDDTEVVATVSPDELRAILRGAGGLALETLTGYQGEVTFGSFWENRGGVKKQGIDRWQEFLKRIKAGYHS